MSAFLLTIAALPVIALVAVLLWLYARNFWRARRQGLPYQGVISETLATLSFFANMTKDRNWYPVKQRLLQRFATPDGHDWQHIKKECYTCDGTGIYMHDYHGRVPCNRCINGVYDEKWVKLLRWRWCGYTFHQPVESRSIPPAIQAVQIEGYIESHWLPLHLERECLLWLLLIFSPRAWWKKMRSGCFCHRNYLPMVALNHLACEVSSLRWRFERCQRNRRHAELLKQQAQWRETREIPF